MSMLTFSTAFQTWSTWMPFQIKYFFISFSFKAGASARPHRRYKGERSSLGGNMLAGYSSHISFQMSFTCLNLIWTSLATLGALMSVQPARDAITSITFKYARAGTTWQGLANVYPQDLLDLSQHHSSQRAEGLFGSRQLHKFIFQSNFLPFLVKIQLSLFKFNFQLILCYINY